MNDSVRRGGGVDAGAAVLEGVRLNDTALDFGRESTVHELVLAQGSSTPQATAVGCEGRSLTYSELESRSGELAERLGEHGIGAGSVVGVLLERNLSLPVALLAVLRAGAAYLPLDPDYPRERLDLMVRDSGAQLIVSETALEAAVGCEEVPRVLPDRTQSTVSPAAGERRDAGAADLAYLIYTSGSTGRPKGVEVTHGGVVNLLLSMERELGLTAGDAILAITTISFDISVLEIFLPLITGGRVEVASRAAALDGALLAERLAQGDIRLLQGTPTTWRMLLEAGWEGTAGLMALSGGEPLAPRLVERLLPRCDSLWNGYGPTETTIYSTLARVTSAEPPIPIGRPLANTEVRIVDEELRPVVAGDTGELLIGGLGLARGYRDRAELTAERFVPLAGEDDRAKIFYRTGDLASVLPDGALQCLGRIDHQIKLRGFRIEPGEIEALLETHPAVSGAVVTAREDEPGDRRLAAYVAASADLDEGALASELRELTRARLPAYMVPSAFVRLPALPVTANGKVDRLALPKPTAVAGRGTGVGRRPSGAIELEVAAAWQRALRLDEIGAQENFLELGGNSLLMHQIRGELEKALGRRIPMVELFRRPTVAETAAFLEIPPTDDEGESGAAGVYAKGDPHSLSLLARRFLIPRSLLSLYFYWLFRARVSPRAEVELSPNLTFGHKTTVGSFTKIKADKGPLVVGERSSFANGCFIGSGPAGLHIGRHLVCGPSVTIVPSNYVFEAKGVHLADQGHTSKGIRIGNDVWIGAGSTILDGAELGDNTVVVAGSVVDGKFPAGCILRGNPAEIVARR